MRVERCEIQPRVFERGGEVAPEDVGCIVVVERDPGDDQSLFLRTVGDIRQHGGLAKSCRRPQHREPPLQQPVQALQQRRSAQVSFRRLRRDHFRLQQPGRNDARRGSVRIG